MEPISIALLSLFTLTAGVLGWQLFIARETLQAVVDRSMVLSESQGAHANKLLKLFLLFEKKLSPMIPSFAHYVQLSLRLIVELIHIRKSKRWWKEMLML